MDVRVWACCATLGSNPLFKFIIFSIRAWSTSDWRRLRKERLFGVIGVIGMLPSLEATSRAFSSACMSSHSMSSIVSRYLPAGAVLLRALDSPRARYCSAFQGYEYSRLLAGSCRMSHLTRYMLHIARYGAYCTVTACHGATAASASQRSPCRRCPRSDAARRPAARLISRLFSIWFRHFNNFRTWSAVPVPNGTCQGYPQRGNRTTREFS